MITKLLTIHGRVQGVFYRESMRQEAMRLGVTGWVRNRKNGTVEALIQGEAPLVADLIAWCHQGPPAAKVEKVEEKTVPAENALRDFIRKQTED